jgi:hypothetical protein
MRQVVLLRVGVDAGSGGIQGPLFDDGSFEFICIPDRKAVSEHKYGTCVGRNGIPHSDYFPPRGRRLMAEKHVHFDPEFETFTYGDPTTPKGSLKTLKRGDLLVFYCGLQEWDSGSGWNREVRPGLYVIGYFEVAMAGLATEFSQKTLRSEFGKNFHVRYPSVFEAQRDRLVLVKGGPRSRLLKKAYRISVDGKDRAGKPLKVLSPAMRNVFGDFSGHVSIQRSPPRWIEPAFVDKSIKWVAGLR